MPLKELSSFRLNGLAVDESRHFISTVTRLSPSPDWFTGLNAFSTQQDGFWYSEFAVETMALDAGTSTGNTYNAIPTPESPTHQLIQLVSNGVFNTLPVARWRCVLTTSQFNAQEIVQSTAPQQTPVVPAPIPEVTSETMTVEPSLAPSKAPASRLSTAQSDVPSDLPSSGLSDPPATIAEGNGTGTDTVDLNSGTLNALGSFAIGTTVVFLLM